MVNMQHCMWQSLIIVRLPCRVNVQDSVWEFLINVWLTCGQINMHSNCYYMVEGNPHVWGGD